MLPIRSLDLVDSNITQTLTGWTYFLHFPVTGRVARAFSGVFYIGNNKRAGDKFVTPCWKVESGLLSALSHPDRSLLRHVGSGCLRLDIRLD